MSVFMNYEGIQGESSDKNHKGWMDIESWSWGTRRKITSVTSTQRKRSTNPTLPGLATL
jgi:type VI secretion system secreted protein Hcp